MEQGRRTYDVPWRGRLWVRVVSALALLGTLCVGASAYLVNLAVDYFDARVGDTLTQAQAVAREVEPFHHALVDSQISAWQARTALIAARFVSAQGTPQARVDALFEAEPDLVQLRVELADGTAAARDREASFPSDAFDWFDVTTPLMNGDAARAGQLQAVFRIDPAIDARYQQLGEIQRGLVVEQESRVAIEDAVERVLGIASGLVLMLALAAGYAVARATTHKATELSRVMTAVADGDLSVRSSARGADELGQLSLAFNDMLEQLQRAQERVAYLQRIGAWQEMARRIAHEIKNPLTPILLAVQQLRDKDPGLSPKFSAMLATSTEIVEDEVQALRRMVSSFSQFAKVPQVRCEPVSLARVLDEFERAYGHLTDEAEDLLTVEAPSPDPEVLADRQLIKQVLVNLVENAVLSAREAGRSPVRVEVSAIVSADAVEIRVDDNGPGIEPERRTQVFEPYETTREQGTGLGLAIVKKVALDHRGDVWVDASHLGGARFCLRIPVAATASRA
jgi:nitrogen fixation/metabolism regulation signal transduction histidine kinase